MSPQERPSGRRRALGRAAAFAAGCALVVLASGAWHAPAGVARGIDYFPPETYVGATVQGTIRLQPFDFFIDTTPGGEDIGYPILRQAWILAGGDGSFETAAELHNAFVVACALTFATATAVLLRSVLVGWIALALVLLLRHALRGLLFGGLDNRSLIVAFPLAFTLLVVLVEPAIRRLHRAAGFLALLAIGGVLGLADLVRHSEGLLAFAAMMVTCLLARASLRRRAAAIGLVILGSSAVTYAVPMGVRLFNDVRTGQYADDVVAYLRPIPPARHSPWHSLQISLGRYPNPEGLLYRDIDGWLAVAKAFPEVSARAGPYEAARVYYLWYVRTHPLAWLRALGAGLVEVFYFVPYVTSVGDRPWVLGNLPAKEGVILALIVDPRDVGCDRELFPQGCDFGHGSLTNLRLPYLQLGTRAWAVYLGSLICILAALGKARTDDPATWRVLLSLVGYLALAVGARALIPAYGQALVVTYWGLTILAGLYLTTLRLRPGHPFPASRDPRR